MLKHNHDLVTDSGIAFQTGKMLGRGGEGDVYEVQSTHRELPQQAHVVKVYHPDKRTVEREQKLRFMIHNPPDVPPAGMGHQAIAWPTQCCYSPQGRFLGFIMPRMNLAKAEDLTFLCGKTMSPGADSIWHRFDRSAAEAFILRLRVGFNVAAALQSVHKVRGYVLVDFKPDNVKVATNGLITLLDMDSVQITAHGQALFSAPVWTPEYTPPEGQLGTPVTNFSTHWDDFSLAVVLYKLFLGIHPYTGTCSGRYAECNETALKISNGLFPHGKAGRHFLKVPLRDLFDRLPKPVRSLFVRCFDAGHSYPAARPSADAWCQVLNEAKSAPSNRGLIICSAANPRGPRTNIVSPRIRTFSANALSVVAGGSVILSWVTAGADRVFISGVGGVAPQGTLTVTPGLTTTYVLTAAGKGGQVTQSLRVEVVEPLPIILQFTASPNPVVSGDIVRFDWVCVHASSVQLVPGPGLPLPVQGTVTAMPRTSTDYRLVATSPVGTTSATIHVEVRVALRALTTLQPPATRLAPNAAFARASSLGAATAALRTPHNLAPVAPQLLAPTRILQSTKLRENTALQANSPLQRNI